MRPVVILSVVLVAGLLSSEAHAAPPQNLPLVSTEMGSGFRSDDADVELVRKKGGDDDSGDKGALDYLMMAFKFEDVDVAEEVADGRIIEHVLGGILSALGGHIWAPMIAYKEVEQPPAALHIGIASTVFSWLWVPLLVFYVVPIVGFIVSCIWAIFDLILQFWIFPRALQFAYSDAYGSGGGSKKSKKSKKKKRSDDDDDE